LAQRIDGAENVLGGQRQVLDTGATVELQILVDLRTLLADGGLIKSLCLSS